MDESKHSIPPSELNLRPASESVVVYCGNEEEVSRGFLIALSAMGVAVVSRPTEASLPGKVGLWTRPTA
jgi:hypothetical protein